MGSWGRNCRACCSSRHCFRQPVFGQEHPQVIGGLGKLGIAFQGGAQCALGFGSLALFGQQQAQVKIGRGIAGLQLQGLPQGFLGLLVLPGAGVGQGGVYQGQDAVGPQSVSQIKGLQGLGILLLAEIVIAQVVMRGPVVGPRLQGIQEFLGGLGQTRPVVGGQESGGISRQGVGGPDPHQAGVVAQRRQQGRLAGRRRVRFQGRLPRRPAPGENHLVSPAAAPAICGRPDRRSTAG